MHASFNISFCYRIKPDKFIFMRDQIKELFPTVDTDIFYIPYTYEDTKCTVGQGYLYNEYKTVRKDLRIAGILLPNKANTKDAFDDSLSDTEDGNERLSIIQYFLSESRKMNFRVLYRGREILNVRQCNTFNVSRPPYNTRKFILRLSDKK